jgi:hypothetical protein
MTGRSNEVWGKMLANMMGLKHDIIARPEGWSAAKIKKCNKALLKQFKSDMTAAGFEVRPYSGRFYYNGLGVITGDYEAVVRATNLTLNYDSCGLDKIVYPALIQDPTPNEIEISHRVAAELEHEGGE